jgi:hypothetical protein
MAERIVVRQTMPGLKHLIIRNTDMSMNTEASTVAGTIVTVDSIKWGCLKSPF